MSSSRSSASCATGPTPRSRPRYSRAAPRARRPAKPWPSGTPPPEPVAQERDERERQEDQPAREAAQEREREEAVRRAEQRRRERGETGRVTRVIDGDTVEIEGLGTVRLIGVDTPERGEECFDEATAYLRGRVGGQTVRYRPQREREDRYDRQLLHIFRGGELINLDIAQAGWGEKLTIQPNSRYASRIAQAERDARAAPRGRWAGCEEAPEEPERKPQREPDPEPQPDPEPSGGDCDPGYSGCVPVFPPDVNCPDVDGPVTVTGSDPHGLDRDGDGVACE